MEGQVDKLLFSILRSALRGEQMTAEEKDLVATQDLTQVWQIAQKHDLVHLVAMGLLENNLIEKEKRQMVQRHVFAAAYRYERQNRELQRLCDALEGAKIPFVPLKGSVLRAYYPEPWMRTSCDIDILVKEQDTQLAKVLLEEMGFAFQGKGRHDLRFQNAGTYVELHYTLIEDDTLGVPDRILKKVWDNVQAVPGKEYQKQMTDDCFYFYHLAHMAKHFVFGGCGIRPFIDLWILDRMPGADIHRRNTLLQKGGLLQFARTAQRLRAVWLDGEQLDPVTEKMQNFVISGGVYGTAQNRIAVQQLKKGSKMKYAVSRIILPHEIMKYRYPVLQKQPWLNPVMQVYRWIWVLACGRTKRSVRELVYSQKISKDQFAQIGVFLEEIGL